MNKTVVVVEDDGELRKQLVELLGTAPDVRCLGAFASGEEALQKIPGLKPDIVLMDIQLPRMSGIRCVAELKKIIPGLRVIMVTIYEDSDRIFKALKAGANGYLLDQFLQDGSNHRTDEYGGSIKNRARLMLEVTDAVTSVWEADQVGMHLAPRMDSNGAGDSDPLATFSYVAAELGERGLAFICAREYQGPDSLGPRLKKIFGGTFIANENFTLQTAQAVLAAGDADAVAWGKLFIATPDLVARFKSGAPLNEPNTSAFYAGGAEGYTDYPALESALA